MMIHLVQAGWPFRDSQVRESGSFTLKKVEDHYKLYLDNKSQKKAINLSQLLFSFGTDRRYHNGNRALRNAIKNGKATIRQTGDTEGWGISTNSLEEAKQLARATANAYKKKEEAEEKKQQLSANKQVEALRKLTPAQLNKTVYFYFKQDYDYRGMHDTFKGTMKMSELVQYSIAFLTDDRAAIEKIEHKYNKQFKDDSFDSCLSEAFSMNQKLVEELLKKGSVVESEEVGYEAFSLKSAKHARSLVAERLLNDRMDD